MKVLALASYPVQAAATRYRLVQFAGPLADRGISLIIRPFLDAKLFERLYQRKAVFRNGFGILKAILLRLNDLIMGSKADVILVQREAMMFGPPILEWFLVRVCRRPMVLDLDDATYVRYTSPTYGGIGSALKWFGKTDDLIRWAKVVTCGNSTIAKYVSANCTAVRVIPTVVDTDLFRPLKHASDPVMLGWIGTHSTLPYLKTIFPVLEDLARRYQFRLKIVGAGTDQLTIKGVEIENLKWRLDREVDDFQSIDIGLYPINPKLYAEGWAAGKSGFKAIQYMAVGVPYVATPVGATAEIGEPGITHFCATSNEEWTAALQTLISDPKMRQVMGAAGRRHVVEHYGLAAQADKLAMALQEAVAKS